MKTSLKIEAMDVSMGMAGEMKLPQSSLTEWYPFLYAGDMNRQRGAPTPNPTLQHCIEQYLRECEYSRRLRPETLRGYQEVFRHFQATLPKITELSMLNAQSVADFFHRIQVRKRIIGRNTERIGVKDSTIRTYWSKLNSFFEWLRIRGAITENPLASSKAPEVYYDDKRALEAEEIHKIIAAITLHSLNSFLKKRDLLIIQLLLFCGLRKTELLSLQISDVDMDKRILTVRGSTSKSKRTRQIPIHQSLHMHLEEYMEERKQTKGSSAYLIVSFNQQRQLSHHGLKHWVDRLNILSGVKFHLHRFRHSFACNLARQNVSATKIQKLMGHTDLRMTERYVRSLSVDDLRDDINKMNIDNLY